jgi:hypothetical protein
MRRVLQSLRLAPKDGVDREFLESAGLPYPLPLSSSLRVTEKKGIHIFLELEKHTERRWAIMDEKNVMRGVERPADIDHLLTHSQGGVLRDRDVVHLRIRKEKQL